ncbi:MAG: autotransporter domain-containing protein [Phycisphaerae bacterium]|nr:autotransporter domain-containing protein [Phycisphaerae bacterium]
MKTQIKSISHSFISVIIISLLIVSPAWANFVWEGDVDGDWQTGGNWTGGAKPTGAVGTLTFGDISGGVHAITAADDALTGVDGINFNSSDAAYSITGTGSLTFSTDATITGDLGRIQTFSAGLGFVSDGLTFDGADSYTVSGAISGTTIVKSGVGTLTFSGTNTYTGSTTISAGTLIASGGSAIADAGAVSLADVLGAGFEISASETIGSLSGGGTTGGNVNLNANTLTVGDGSNTTYSGVISGAGALTKEGGGTLTLDGTNTYTGITTLNAGKLSIGADSGLGTAPGGATATQITFGGGTLETSADMTLNANRGITLTGAGTIDVDAGTTLTYNGIIAGASTLAKADTGTLSLGGTNTYTGATSVDAGTLLVTADQALGTAAAGTTVVSGATLGLSGGVNYSTAEALNISGTGVSGVGALHNVGGDNTFAGNIILGVASTIGSSGDTLTASGTINNGGFLLTTAGAGNVTLSGVISGGGGLTKTGAGTTTLSGVGNSYTGTTTINAGTLIASGGAAIADAGAVSLADVLGAGFEISASETIGSLSGGGTTGGNVNLNANTLTVGDGSNTTYSGVISGAGALTKEGGGTLTLDGTNTYTGITTLNAGKLSIGADSGLGTAPGGATATQITFGGGTLETSADMTLNANRGITLTGAGTIDVDAGTTLTYNGIIAGASTLAKADTGTLSLGGTNTYTGATSVDAGTLLVTADQALGTAAAGTTVVSGATLGLSGGVNYSTAEALNISGTGVSGVGALHNVGGDNTFAGNIILGVASTIGSSGDTLTASGTINNGGFLLTTAGAGNVTLSGVISGGGGLTKTGAGTTTLSGVGNSYTGTTTINAGTLIASGGAAIADAGAVSLADVLGAGFEISASETIGSLSGGGTTGGNVNLNANTLTVGDGSNTTYSGVISGAGALTKEGGGTLTLDGTNTYTGITTLNAGTIVLGADAALGTGGLTLGGAAALQSNLDARTVSNTIATGGNILTVSGASNLALSGIISGIGSLTVNMATAADTLTLSGTNTYTGGTTVTTGILTGTTNSLQGDIANGAAGTVIFNQAFNGTYADVISGAGALTKAGAGTLTLSGNNTITGLTTLTAGGLILNGQVGGGLTVTGGTLSGIGTVTGTVTLNGGTFSPGNSIGTTTIIGNYIQTAGTLEVEVSKTGGADLLDVSGTANIGAGSTIHVLDISPVGNIIVTGDTFNIIQAGGAITDGGPTITDNSAVLSFTGGISGAFYQLTATRQAFAAAGGMGAAGGPLSAIDSDMANASGDYVTLINALTALNTTQLNNAEKQLDPLPYGSSTTVSIRTTQQMAGNLANYLSARRSGTGRAMMFDSQMHERQTLIADASNDPRMLAYVINENKKMERMQEKETEDNSIKGFFRPFGVFYNHDTTSNMTGFDAKAVGALFGIDRNYGANWIVGIGGGYTRSSIHFKDNRGEGETDSFKLGPYASYSKGNFFADTSVSLGFHENDNKRNIRFPGMSRTARSDYSAYDLSVYAGTGYDFHVKDLTVTPTASMQYITYHTESFREKGAGAAGLDVDATTSESLRSKLGVTLSKVLELHGIKVVPEVFAGWAHEFMDDENIRARFVQGTAKFTTNVDDDWDDSVYFGTGISALLRKNVSAFVRYEGEYSSGNGINALNFGVTILF